MAFLAGVEVVNTPCAQHKISTTNSRGLLCLARFQHCYPTPAFALVTTPYMTATFQGVSANRGIPPRVVGEGP